MISEVHTHEDPILTREEAIEILNTPDSALTFGAATKASAPGQINVNELEQILDIIHKSL